MFAKQVQYSVEAELADRRAFYRGRFKTEVEINGVNNHAAMQWCKSRFGRRMEYSFRNLSGVGKWAWTPFDYWDATKSADGQLFIFFFEDHITAIEFKLMFG